MRRLGLVFALFGCTPAPSQPPAAPESPAPQLLAPPKSAASEPAAPRLLHPIAFREGSIELASWADQAFALIDGEPIPLIPGQAPAREPALGRGLAPDKAYFASTHELVAFGGSLAGDAQLVYAEHLVGTGSSYVHYAREGEAWVRRPLASRGGELRIETHYGAIVATGGALLGLRRHTIRSELWTYGDDGDPRLAAELDKLGRALGKTKRGFVVLGGALERVPALPQGFDASDAVSTPAGDIVALGYRHRAELDGEDGPARLLSWAPGETDATILELPGLPEPAIHELGLWASGAQVLVGGLRELPGPDDRPYLALREHDGSWREVELELPATVHERVFAAASTPEGELWIVTGAYNYASEAPCRCLWRKPIAGAWEEVALESVAPVRDAQPRWAHVFGEQTWIEIPPAPARRLVPAARSVLAAGGAIWVGAELGPSYPSVDPILGDPRTVVFASVPVPAPVELIATDQLQDERHDRRVATTTFTPGSDDCRTFTLVVVEDPDGEGRETLARLQASLDALRDAATLEREDGWASASMIYVGELDGRAQLVVEVTASPPYFSLFLFMNDSLLLTGLCFSFH